MSYATPYIGKKVQITIDRPIWSTHPKYGYLYEVNYGYIDGTRAPDDEGIDAYILGISEPLTMFDGICIAVIHRLNDDDDKLIVVPEGIYFDDVTIRSITYFQEQFFESQIIR